MFDVFKRYSTGNFPTTGFLLMICFHHLILETSAIWSALECWVLLLNYIWICLKRSKEWGGGIAWMLRQFSRHALLFYQIKIQHFSKLYVMNGNSNLIWTLAMSDRANLVGAIFLMCLLFYSWDNIAEEHFRIWMKCKAGWAKMLQKHTCHSLSKDQVIKIYGSTVCNILAMPSPEGQMERA